MEKNSIKDNIETDDGLATEKKNLIYAIEEAKAEIDRAREMFELVSDPKLVDYAIYMEEAAKSKLMYLLSEARKCGIKVENDYAIKNASAV
jgi:hypothetical protein